MFMLKILVPVTAEIVQCSFSLPGETTEDKSQELMMLDSSEEAEDSFCIFVRKIK